MGAGVARDDDGAATVPPGDAFGEGAEATHPPALEDEITDRDLRRVVRHDDRGAAKRHRFVCIRPPRHGFLSAPRR